MITFGFIRTRKEMEAEMLNMIDEEMISQMGQSSTGFNNPLIQAAYSKRNSMMPEPPSNKEAGNAFNSAFWGRSSVEDAAAGQRNSLRSLNNSSKMAGPGPKGGTQGISSQKSLIQS